MCKVWTHLYALPHSIPAIFFLMIQALPGLYLLTVSHSRASRAWKKMLLTSTSSWNSVVLGSWGPVSASRGEGRAGQVPPARAGLGSAAPLCFSHFCFPVFLCLARSQLSHLYCKVKFWSWPPALSAVPVVCKGFFITGSNKSHFSNKIM